MDGKVFFATFAAVFIAELADKTQFVGIGMASKTGKLVSVWLGSVAAYCVVTLFSVLIGVALGKYLKPEFIRYLASSLKKILALTIPKEA